MADNTVDTLSLEIKSSSSQAEKALDTLARKLLNVNKALQSVNTGGLRNYARDMGKVSASLRALNGIKVNVPNLGGVTKQLKSIANVDFSKLSASAKPLKDLSIGLRSLSGLQNISVPKIDIKNINSVINAIAKLQSVDTAKIPKISDGLTRVAHAMSVLNTVNFSDSKITTVIGSLKKLLSVDVSKFDTTIFSNIATAMGALASVPDVSSSLNRFIASLAKLAGTGASINTVSIQLPALGKALRDVVNKMSGVGKISESVNLFVQSIAKLASAGSKTGQTAAGLQKLSEETLKFFQAMSKAPKISQNTIAMTQALAQLASAGGRVGVATGTITGAFNKLSGLGSKTANAIKKAAGTMVSSFKNIGSGSKHLNTASFGLSSLLKSALAFGAVRGIFNFGKEAITLGSDITEVENVVDTAFGSMANKAYEFASTATKQFGLSELAAKQYSGTMMAMLNSSGVAQGAAAEMSTTLAGLAGDLASFYNLDTDEAFRKIRSGISGEIEPLRQLGINMSVANVEAYALSQGITKSYQSMSQAEQATLRYNYLMSVTTQQQGDFAKTAGTFANQWRLLKLNIQSTAAVIGQGLIAAVLPGIKALNALMGALMKAAEAFRTFVYTLTGHKLEGSAKGISDYTAGVSDLGGAGENASDGIDKATGATKKLKKALSVLPFDQLNQLTANEDTSTGSAGGGGGGAGDLSGADLGDGSSLLDDLGKTDVEGPINKWAQRIRKAFLAHDWDKLGFEIADGLNRGLQKIYDAINWENVGPKITAFTNAFTQTFNSLVDNFDWDLLGRTVGTGINTLVNTLNLLIDGINWQNLGTKFSTGIMGLVHEINWENLGNLLGNGFMISWNILYGVVTGLNYEEIGISLGNAVNGIFEKIDFTTIGMTLSIGFNGIFESLKNFTNTVNWNDIAINIYNGLNTMIHNINWEEAGASLSQFVTDLLGTFKKVAEKTDWHGLGKGIGDFLGNIDWKTILADVGTIIFEAASGMFTGLFDSESGSVFKVLAGLFVASKLTKTFLNFGNAISTAMTGQTITGNILSKVGTWFAKTVIPGIFPEGTSILGAVGTWITGTFAPTVASAFGTVVTTLFSPIGLTVVGAIIGGFLIWKNWDKIKEFAGNVKEKVVEGFNNAKEWLKEKGKNLIEGLKNGYESSKQSVLSKVSKLKDEINSSIGKLENHLPPKGKAIIEGIKNGYTKAKESGLLAPIKMLRGDVFGAVGDIKTKLIPKGKDIIAGLKDGYNRSKESGFLSNVKQLKENVFKSIGNTKEKVKSKGSDIIKGLKEGLNGNWNTLGSWLSQLPSKIRNAIPNLYNVGSNAISSFINGFKSLHIPLPHINVSWNRHNIGPLSFSTPSFGLNWYKKGGLFSKASLIGVGEAGQEAVLPLENPRTMSRIADSITDNMDGGYGLSKDEMRQAVAEGVAMAMMNNQQNPINVTCYAELRTENDEVLARAVTRGQEKLDYRFNATPKFA